MLTGESAPGARVVITSDEDLDRDYDFAFDETARGVKVTIKRRGMRRLFGMVRKHPHTHYGQRAHQNGRPPQHIGRIDQGLTR